MDIQKVKSLFALFSGVEDPEKHLPLLMSVTDEIMKYVHPNANSEDIRLCYLVGSVANLRYMYNSAKAIADMNMPDKKKQVEFAKQLVGSYCDLCADLLIDTKDNTALYSAEV